MSEVKIIYRLEWRVQSVSVVGYTSEYVTLCCVCGWFTVWNPIQSNLSQYLIRVLLLSGPGSSVGIVIDYGLDGPEIESRWGEIFPPVQTGPGAHPASCTMGTGSFPGVRYGWGVLLTTYHLLVPRSWKSRAIPLPTLWATTGPVTGTLHFY